MFVIWYKKARIVSTSLNWIVIIQREVIHCWSIAKFLKLLDFTIFPNKIWKISDWYFPKYLFEAHAKLSYLYKCRVPQHGLQSRNHETKELSRRSNYLRPLSVGLIYTVRSKCINQSNWQFAQIIWASGKP